MPRREVVLLAGEITVLVVVIRGGVVLLVVEVVPAIAIGIVVLVRVFLHFMIYN